MFDRNTAKGMIIEQLAQPHGDALGFDVRTTDFHALSAAQKDRLQHWMKAYGYRAPKDASGSPSRCFFQMLARFANRS